ncbi:hypothetical protein ARMGADRAFT_1038794 [Armillaria gallica]|uniref:Uncharacterized protein n=1 Tax=Armillaria gallica TaxID=47427 RepID=A0A2H3CUS9_ARMGA|nr:hypothetical protein ARMGADRAFT_1038794 [Armillaria gallica]
MRLSPTLRTLTVEHVSRIWEWKSPYSARPWAEVDRLALPALEHLHVRLHNAVLDTCYYDAECYTCELQVRAEQQTDPGDLNYWKRQVEERMPLLKERGILDIEVVKQRQGNACAPKNVLPHDIGITARRYDNELRVTKRNGCPGRV